MALPGCGAGLRARRLATQALLGGCIAVVLVLAVMSHVGTTPESPGVSARGLPTNKATPESSAAGSADLLSALASEVLGAVHALRSRQAQPRTRPVRVKVPNASLSDMASAIETSFESTILSLRKMLAKATLKDPFNRTNSSGVIMVPITTTHATTTPTTLPATTWTTTPRTNKVFIRHFVQGDLCMDMTGDALLYPCNGGQAQGNIFGPGGTLSDVSGEQCAEQVGARVQPMPCSSSPKNHGYQTWHLINLTLANTPSGTAVRNIQSGQCLAVATTNHLVARACDGSCHQRFVFSHISGLPDSNYPGHLAGRPTAIAARRDMSAELGVSNVRVLCWIHVPVHYKVERLNAINNTWGRDCNILLFSSQTPLPGLETIITSGGGLLAEHREYWMRTMQMWMELYFSYADKADWFFRADDTTYANIHHLRKIVAKGDPSKVEIYGRTMHMGGVPGPDRTYVAGNHIISRAALHALGQIGESGPTKWAMPIDGAPDVQTSMTLNAIGVHYVDTRDATGRNRFLPFGPRMERKWTRRSHVRHWLFNYSSDTRDGAECCSDEWISAHSTTPDEMYSIYHAQQSACALDPRFYPFLAGIGAGDRIVRTPGRRLNTTTPETTNSTKDSAPGARSDEADDIAA